MTNGTDVVMIYTTFATGTDAAALGRRLVEERLAACVNILPAMHSIYSWKGEVEEGDEAVMLVKTTAARAAAAAGRIEELHPYETPAVLVLAVAGGSAPYLAWIADETR